MSTRELAPDKFKDALAALAKHNVPISDAVALAAKELKRVENIKPVFVTPENLAAMFRDPKAKPADLITLASEVATVDSRSRAWRHARTGAGVAGLSTIALEVGEIVEVLRPAAEAHIAALVWFAEAGDPDVTQLVREHRTDDATRAATAPLHYADFEALVKLRHELSGKRFDWSKAGRWSNPEVVAEAMAYKKQLLGLPFLTAGVRASGLLWWPTMEQAAVVTERVVDAEDAAQIEEWKRDKLIKQSAM